jgi:hypothetical protein
MPDGELVTAGYVAVVCVCKLCVQSSGRPECKHNTYIGVLGLL